MPGVYIQGSNGCWPDGNAALKGFTRDGKLKPAVANQLERLVRECDRRGMVVMVGLFTHRKDQEFYADAATRRAAESAARFLRDRRLRNVFVDVIHEFGHPERMDKELFREPGGEGKKAGRHRRCPDRPAAARRAEGAGGSVPAQVPEQPQAEGAGHPRPRGGDGPPAADGPQHPRPAGPLQVGYVGPHARISSGRARPTARRRLTDFADGLSTTLLFAEVKNDQPLVRDCVSGLSTITTPHAVPGPE